MKFLDDLNEGKLNKAVYTTVAAAVAFATEVVYSAPHAITSKEWLHGGVGLAFALGVYQVSNKT